MKIMFVSREGGWWENIFAVYNENNKDLNITFYKQYIQHEINRFTTLLWSQIFRSYIFKKAWFWQAKVNSHM